MGEHGLSPAEVGKDIAEHRRHTASTEATGAERTVTIVEAVLLAAVAILAAWSGYASAKWGTEQSLTLSRAATARTEASRANLDAMENRTFDSSTFDAWFLAYTLHDQTAMTLAERRFRPQLQAAFQAWRATNPESDPTAPKGPTYMAEYRQPDKDKAVALDAQADQLYAEGARDGATADGYVRTTVFLATVLFLVGISGHFRVRAARYGLVGLGATILLVSIGLLLAAPKPPA